METVTFEVPSKIARLFNQLPTADKKLFFSFLELWIIDENIRKKNPDLAIKEFLENVKTIGLNATKRGMTDEILESILNED